MKSLFPLSVLGGALLGLAACGTSSPLPPLDSPEPAPVDPGEPTPRLSACDATYGGPGDVGLPRTAATVAPTLLARLRNPADALQPVELLLSFNSFAERDAAFAKLPLLPELLTEGGKLLGLRFQRLPILSVRVPALTADLLTQLQHRFNGQGLLSIYPRDALTAQLQDTRAGIGSLAAAEDFGADGTGIGVVVVDSGVDGTHPDLDHLAFNAKAIGIPGLLSDLPSLVRFVELPNTDTTSGHGTHVAGTIGGRGALLEGKYTGMAPGATLISLGAGDAISILYALESFDYLLDPAFVERYNVRVTNNSYGGGTGFDPGSPDAIAHRIAWQAGIVSVFAAGNSGGDGPNGGEALNSTGRQANGPCVISVGSLDRDLETLSNFSSRGLPEDPMTWPDITAPGRGVTATRGLTGLVATPPVLSCSDDLTFPPCAYSSISGTSMASPHVAGVVAQMLQVNPRLTPQDVLDILKDTAVPLAYTAQDSFLTDGSADGPHQVGDPYPAYKVGAGRVDAYAAVARAQALAPTTPEPVFFFPDPDAVPPEYTATPLVTYDSAVGAGVCDPVGLLGLCLVGGEADLTTFELPAGFDAVRITVSWLLPTDDLDIAVFLGERSVGASASLDNPEVATLIRPEAGTYTLQVTPFLNLPTRYTVIVEGLTLVAP